MIQPEKLIAKFNHALSEKWGYIMNEAGSRWTQQRQDADKRPEVIRYGQRWVGHKVSDCSGLFSWAFKQLGGTMYHGSNTMWRKYMTSKGELKNGKRTDGMELLPGTAVFKNRGDDYYHVGLYIGNGEVIEAKGTAYGVVKSKISAWHAWGEMKGVDYRNAAPDVPDTTDEKAEKSVKPADKPRNLRYTQPYIRGEDVKELQESLNALGFNCGNADGIFGKKTQAGVKSFQAAHGLTVDGIVGIKTRESLLHCIV